MRRRYRLHYAPRHAPGDPGAPHGYCQCSTCEGARADAHWQRVGDMLGLEDHGACPCGRARDKDGRCIAYWQCPYSVEGATR